MYRGGKIFFFLPLLRSSSYSSVKSTCLKELMPMQPFDFYIGIIYFHDMCSICILSVNLYCLPFSIDTYKKEEELVWSLYHSPVVFFFCFFLYFYIFYTICMYISPQPSIYPTSFNTILSFILILVFYVLFYLSLYHTWMYNGSFSSSRL